MSAAAKNDSFTLSKARIVLKMKKPFRKIRLRDVLRSYKHRTQPKINFLVKKYLKYSRYNKIFEGFVSRGLVCSSPRDKNNEVIIHLPAEMNLEHNHAETAIYLNAISTLVELIRRSNGYRLPKKAYRLVGVNFDRLKKISTPAALILTAEMSNWEDTINNRLKPTTTNWSDEIYRQFYELGFFDLFKNKPNSIARELKNKSGKKLVRYIKGECNESGKTLVLKNKIAEIVGESVKKWTFLHGGLDEAITNVSHHAYPKNGNRRTAKKCWYLTGSYDDENKELEIVFFDQGIGIPKTLPKNFSEEVLSTLTINGDGDSISAAMELGRTRTRESDRGKGLPDLLTFLQKRESGNLSIFSLKGKLALEIKKDSKTEKCYNLSEQIPGTLIIWKVSL